MKPSPKLKPYNKKLSYSYSFGSYPTLELLKYKKENVLKVIFHSQSEKSDGATEVLKLCNENKIPYEFNDRAIEKIAYKENTYLIGIFEKFPSMIDLAENQVILVSPKNMGNLGTIIRSMIGFGVYNLAMIKPAADIFDPKVVRSTMGAFFQLKFQYFDDFDSYLSNVSGVNLFPFMLDGASEIGNIKFSRPYGLVFGNEGEGLPSEFKDIGKPVLIPQIGDIDSLNLSVSATIGLWEATRDV